MLAPYSADQMYDLIDRVEDYPRFLPWCGGVDVHERTAAILDATLHIHFLGIRSHFRTRDLRSADRLEMQLVEGPFRQLSGYWQFTRLAEDACKIEFGLEYAFSSHTLERLIGPAFEKITGSFADAFMAEAERRFGHDAR